MGSAEEEEAFVPRSRVGAVVVALLTGDEEAAERAAEQPPEPHDTTVLQTAIRLAVRSLFDEDTPPESVADFVETMARDIEVDRTVAEAVIRSQLGDGDGLADLPEQDVSDATWSTLGYLCERQLGVEESLRLVAYAEQEVLSS